MTSPDLTRANIEKLAELFPSVVTETLDAEGNPAQAIDFDLLRQELSDRVVEGPHERYQLDWPGKRAAAFAANAPIAKTLRPMREESVKFESTENLFIEGDNLDALKLLQEPFLGKVKLIYIDPPYNTGNDFVYEDDFAQTTAEYLSQSGQRSSSGEHLVTNPDSSGRFHSDWLSMMYPRLRLARNLLTDDGVFIAAIDDREHANLRELLDLVFGADNFLANVAWQGSGKNDARFTAGGLDYMLIYARSRSTLIANDVRFKGPKRGYDDVMAAGERAWAEAGGDAAKATEIFRAWWKTKPDVEPGLKAYGDIDELGQIYTKGDLASPNPRENLMYDVLHPITEQPVPMHANGWRFSQEAMAQRIAQGRILFGADHTTMPRFKRLLSDMDTQAIRPLVLQERAPASDALMRLLGGKYFDYPKDVDVLATWINAVTMNDKQAIVLDFFAGSGSTAHAVMALNALDAGARRFIVVQLDEPISNGGKPREQTFETIAAIARERLRRAGAEILRTASEVDTGFRAFRVDTTNVAAVDRVPDETPQQALTGLEESLKADRSGEDILFEVLLSWGLDLSMPLEVRQIDGHNVFIVDDGALAACFESEISADLVRALAREEPLRAVFRNSGFTSDAARINAEQIFRELSPATDVKVI